jgi:hypothetical protein
VHLGTRGKAPVCRSRMDNQAPGFHAVIPAQAETQEFSIPTSVGMTLQPKV